MEEESIKIPISKKVFYNPNMRFCRSVSSLALGAINEDIEVIDAFCASGIRGFRYAKENKNVKKLTSIDIDKSAVALAKKCAKINKIKSDILCGNISKLAFENVGDFVEIDPFGTPAPYLLDSMRYFNPKKSGYLSVTATDVAVLCGGKVAPSMKNYHSKPLNCEFTHEIGLRIMIKKIAEVAAEFNFGIKPMISFSNRHYLKSIIKLERSADKAFDSMKNLGYVSLCKKCGWRTSSAFPLDCPNCSKHSADIQTEYAGPLWLGQIHELNFIKEMKRLNTERNYSDRTEISKFLNLLEGEIGLPPYYYNIHNLCKIAKSGQVRKFDSIIDDLRKKHNVNRTHFSDVSIKTNASIEEIIKVIKWKD